MSAARAAPAQLALKAIALVMMTRVVAVAGLLAVVLLSTPAVGERSVGTVAYFDEYDRRDAPSVSHACRTPYSVQAGEIDPGHRFSQGDLEVALHAAAALWNHGAGHELFRVERRGTPVNLRMDGAQARLDERIRLSREHEQWRRKIEQERERIETQNERLRQGAAEYHRDQQRYAVARKALNADIERYNRSGPGSRGEALRLEEESQALRKEAQRLEQRGKALEALQEALAQAHVVHSKQVSEFNTAASVGAGERHVAGQYQRRGSREQIEVFAVRDHHDLTRVVAHEMGHAIGLGHVDVPGSLMAAVAHHGLKRGRWEASLSEADLAELRRVCER